MIASFFFYSLIIQNFKNLSFAAIHNYKFMFDKRNRNDNSATYVFIPSPTTLSNNHHTDALQCEFYFKINISQPKMLISKKE